MALDEGQLTLLSPFPATEKRVSADLARQCNRFVAALADEVVFAYVSPGDSLDKLSGMVRKGGVRPIH